MNPQIKTYDELLREFNKFLLIEDKNILKVLMGTIIANQMPGDPNWIFIVSNSSGGKTEFLQSLYDIAIEGKRLITPISDMTVNALASGQKKIGKETSLLHKVPRGGLLVFKDFTSMLSKNKEAKGEIFKQLREIYDGSYVKATGTGDNVEWKGKLGAIAGATEVIYEHQEEFSAMGDRFLMYSLIQPDRQKVLEFLISEERINADREEERNHLKNCMTDYMNKIFKVMNTEKIELAPDIKKDICAVADFCTKVRSGVVVDDRKSDRIKFVPSPEMPMRMLHQLVQLAKSFAVMKRAEPAGELTPKGLLSLDETAVLYKIAFDSIPIKRRLALKLLTQYSHGATTKALAVALNYQSNVVGGWMAQLNGLGICTRDFKQRGNKGDFWQLKKEYQEIMVKFNHIEVTNSALETEDEADVSEDDIDEAWNQKEEYDKVDKLEF